MNRTEQNHPLMIDFIEKYGYDAFSDAVKNGMFAVNALQIIHPESGLWMLEKFKEIQRAFINAYV
jgi:hypothetical protein